VQRLTAALILLGAILLFHYMSTNNKQQKQALTNYAVTLHCRHDKTNMIQQHLDAFIPVTPNPGSRTRLQPAIDHYDTVSTFHHDNILRNALFDALPQLSGTHYQKLFSVVTLLQFLSLG